MTVQFDYLKFRDVVHVIAERCPNDRLGRVKLHKTLYFADMFTYVGTGRALTGAEYRRQPRGPMASALGRALRDLQDDGSIRIEREDYFGLQKDRFVVARPADRSRLTDRELALLDEIIQFTCVDHTARSISELSHTPAWDSVPPGEVMPYRRAHLMFASTDYDDVEAWAEAEEQKGEAGSDRYLDPAAVRAFRNRLLPGRGDASAAR